MSSIEDNKQFFKKIYKGLTQLDSQGNNPVFFESQRIGPGIGPDRNTLSPRQPQKDQEEAIADEAYRNARLQQENIENPNITDKQEINNKVVDKFIEEIVNRDIFGE